MLTKEQQIFFRSEVLSNLDIEKIDALQSERNLLVNELVQIVNRVASKNGTYLTSADTLVMAEIVADEIEGYGPLRDLMADDTVNDILVNGPDDVWIERAGILEKTNKEFVSNEQLTDIAKRLVARVGRRIDDGSPLVDSRLPDGSRLNVVIAPIALDGTSVSIRKFSKNKKTLQELVNFGSMTREMANFLIIAARSRVNIIVSGGTGSGKTTLLNALSNYISHSERVITLEDTAELRLEQPHVVRLETRLAGVGNLKPVCQTGSQAPRASTRTTAETAPAARPPCTAIMASCRFTVGSQWLGMSQTVSPTAGRGPPAVAGRRMPCSSPPLA